MTDQIVAPARKLTGEISVPGETAPAMRALIVAAFAEGVSRIRNVPPGAVPAVSVLRQMGVKIDENGAELLVEGRGAAGFEPAAEPLDLGPLGEEGMLILAAAAGQPGVTRFIVDSWSNGYQDLQRCLTTGRATIEPEGPKQYRIAGARDLAAARLDIADAGPQLKLAVAIAGLSGQGEMAWVESAKGRDWVVRFLRDRQVEVERKRADGNEQKGDNYLVSVRGGQQLQSLDLEVPGDLSLAYPFAVAALGLKGSELKIRHVAIRPGQRTLLDTLRQMRAPIELVENDRGTVDLTVRAGILKSTRIAGKRTAALLPWLPLVAVLATQAQGEFVFRDIGQLREGSFDSVADLVTVLRQMGAKVGEFPEGIVVEGGYPLQGGRVETRGEPGMIQAVAAAGLLAESEVTVVGSEGVEQVFPHFFETLEACKEKKR